MAEPDQPQQPPDLGGGQNAKGPPPVVWLFVGVDEQGTLTMKTNAPPATTHKLALTLIEALYMEQVQRAAGRSPAGLVVPAHLLSQFRRG